MTKNKKFIYLSSMPVILVVIIIFIAGYLLLAEDLKLPGLDRKPKIRRVEGFPTVIYSDRQTNKTRLIIKSEEELNNFLNTVDSTGLLTLKEKINFNKEYVVAVTSPTRNFDNHSIKIKKVYEDEQNKTLMISVYEYIPDEKCRTVSDNHVAVDLAAINKTTYEFDFERIQETIPCE